MSISWVRTGAFGARSCFLYSLCCLHPVLRRQQAKPGRIAIYICTKGRIATSGFFRCEEERQAVVYTSLNLKDRCLSPKPRITACSTLSLLGGAAGVRRNPRRAAIGTESLR